MESRSMKYISDQGRGASCMRTPMEPQIRLIVESEAQLAKVREAVCGAMVHREADTGVKYVRVAFRYRDEEEDISDIDLFGRLPHAIARKIAEPLRVEVQCPRPRPKSGMMAVRNPISSNWPIEQLMAEDLRSRKKYRAEIARRYVVQEFSNRSRVVEVFDFIMDDLNARDHSIASVGSTILSKKLGCSRSAAQKALTALVSAGVLVVVREHHFYVNGDPKRNRASGYWVYGLERKRGGKTKNPLAVGRWNKVPCPKFVPSASGEAKRQREYEREVLASGGTLKA